MIELNDAGNRAREVIAKVPVRFRDDPNGGIGDEIPVYMPEHQAENIARALQMGGHLADAPPPSLEGDVYAVRISELQKGDIIVYTTPLTLSPEQQHTVSKMLQMILGERNILIVDGGAKIEVVRP